MARLDGGTLVLKKIMPSITQRVERTPLDNPMSLDEINDIVHSVRRREGK
jgi:hypothetical protein